MIALTRDIGYVDLLFQGHSRIIAAAIVHGPFGVAIVDPGPASCLRVLRETLERHGMAIADVRTILLTHIHLDHAGATGTLVRENSSIEVYVHEQGAAHMADPTRLLDSAKQLWLDDMERLWGEVLPVPSSNLHSLAGGERLAIGERELEVAYTPGHARHHVSYFDRASGIVFAGDAAGIRIGSASYVFPPTPPPDIDLEAWRDTAEWLGRWAPDTLFLTHFGPHGGARAHLQLLLEHLDEMSGMARRALEAEASDADRLDRFTVEMSLSLRRHLIEDEARRVEEAAPIKLCWLGLARYWRKRGVGV